MPRTLAGDSEALPRALIEKEKPPRDLWDIKLIPGGLIDLEFIAQVAVIGIPDERQGEVGKAYVVRTDAGPTTELTEEAVVAFCKERLANFKVPRHVEFVDGLPRNLSGKVLKTQLRSS